jgi:3-methyladenine DNA glycosylase AlkD
MTAWSDEYLGRVTEQVAAHAEPARAAAMASYMRNQFAFAGIPTPSRVALSREALGGMGTPSEADLVAFTDAAWARDEREYQYVACWLLKRRASALTSPTLPAVRRWITTRSWWDTVDGLAQHTVGGLVRRDRSLDPVMAAWLVDDDLWLARTAILHQERWGPDTEPEWLFHACATRAGDTEFFLRKAIGWALRSYSHVDPEAVERFVHDHDAELSGLSKREALKAIERTRRRRG